MSTQYYSPLAKVVIQGNGTGGPYAIPFRVTLEDSGTFTGMHDIIVILYDDQDQKTPQVEGVDYTVSVKYLAHTGTANVGTSTGAEINFINKTIPSTYKMVVRRGLSDPRHPDVNGIYTYPALLPNNQTITGGILNKQLANIYDALLDLRDCCATAPHSLMDLTTGLYPMYEIDNLTPDEIIGLDSLGQKLVSAGVKVSDMSTFMTDAQKLLHDGHVAIADAQNTLNHANQLIADYFNLLQGIQTDLDFFKQKYPLLDRLLMQIPDPLNLANGMVLAVENGKYVPKLVITEDNLEEGKFPTLENGRIENRRVLELEGNFVLGSGFIVSKVDKDRVVASAGVGGGGIGGGSGINFLGENDGTGVVAHGGVMAYEPVLHVHSADLPTNATVHDGVGIPTNPVTGQVYPMVFGYDAVLKQVFFMVDDTKSTGIFATNPLRDGQILVGLNGMPIPVDNPLVDFMDSSTLLDNVTPVWDATQGKFVPRVVTTIKENLKTLVNDTTVLTPPNLALNGNNLTWDDFKVSLRTTGQEARFVDIPTGSITAQVDPNKKIQYIYYDVTTQLVGTDLIGVDPNPDAPAKIYLGELITQYDGISLMLQSDYSTNIGLLERMNFMADAIGSRASGLNITGASNGIITQNSAHAYAVGRDINTGTGDADKILIPQGAMTFDTVTSDFKSVDTGVTDLHPALKIESMTSHIVTVLPLNKHAVYGLFYSPQNSKWILLLAQGSGYTTQKDAEDAVLSHANTMVRPLQLTHFAVFIGYIIVKGGNTIDYSDPANFKVLLNIYRIAISTSASGASIPKPTPADAGKYLMYDKTQNWHWIDPNDFNAFNSIPDGKFVYKDNTGHLVGKDSIDFQTGAILTYGFGTFVLDCTLDATDPNNPQYTAINPVDLGTTNILSSNMTATIVSQTDHLKDTTNPHSAYDLEFQVTVDMMQLWRAFRFDEASLTSSGAKLQLTAYTHVGGTEYSWTTSNSTSATNFTFTLNMRNVAGSTVYYSQFLYLDIELA